MAVKDTCRLRAADDRAIRASGLAQIGQFRRPQLRVAIACRWQRWQREEQSVRQCWQAALAATRATSRLTGGLGGRHPRAGWNDRGA